MKEFVTSFRFFLLSTGWDFWFVFASAACGSFDTLRCFFNRASSGMLAPSLRLAGEGWDFTNFPGEEGRPDFSFFFGGSTVRTTSLVSDSLLASASNFLAALAAIDRAFAALCFSRLVFIFSNLAIYTRGYECQRSECVKKTDVETGARVRAHPLGRTF